MFSKKNWRPEMTKEEWKNQKSLNRAVSWHQTKEVAKCTAPVVVTGLAVGAIAGFCAYLND